jgi:hypothetical protein
MANKQSSKEQEEDYAPTSLAKVPCPIIVAQISEGLAISVVKP